MVNNYAYSLSINKHKTGYYLIVLLKCPHNCKWFICLICVDVWVCALVLKEEVNTFPSSLNMLCKYHLFINLEILKQKLWVVLKLQNNMVHLSGTVFEDIACLVNLLTLFFSKIKHCFIFDTKRSSFKKLITLRILKLGKTS